MSESGPNYFSYYKRLVSDLLSENGECIIPLLEADSAIPTGNTSREAEGSHNHDTVNSVPCFAQGVIEGLSEFKTERLKAILKDSAVHFNQDADEMLDLILGTIQIGANLSDASDADLMLLHNNKRKAYSINADYSNVNLVSPRQVYNKIQSLQQMDETFHEAVNKYTVQLLGKLDTMESDLDEFLNIVVSKCRLMTRREKHQLGKKIRKLPDKALDRVAEILRPSASDSLKTVPDNIGANLEEQDNLTLWRLHFYVELVAKVNEI